MNFWSPVNKLQKVLYIEIIESSFLFHRRKEWLCYSGSINFIKPSSEGDVLTAEAMTISEGRTFVLCRVIVRKEDNEIALFSGLAY